MNVLTDKILTELAMPPGIGLVCLVFGLLGLALGFRRFGFTILFASTLALWFLSTPYVAGTLARSLEGAYPLQDVSSYPTVDAIVVLGGGLAAADAENPYFDLRDAGDRVLHAARIYKAGKATKIIATGGNVFGKELKTEADTMADFLVFLGVPRADILIEGQSRNTAENARLSAEIWRSRGFASGLLVTSAFHMPRALSAFEREGLVLTPAATDQLPVDDGPLSLDLLPNARSLYVSSVVLKEWLGTAIYWWRGRV